MDLAHYLAFLTCVVGFGWQDRLDTPVLATSAAARPGPWLFLGSLDGRADSLVLGLHPRFLVAYDLDRCSLLQAWKGSVELSAPEPGAFPRATRVVEETEAEGLGLRDVPWELAVDGEVVEISVRHVGLRMEGTTVALITELAWSGGVVRIVETPRLLTVEQDGAELDALMAETTRPNPMRWPRPGEPMLPGEEPLEDELALFRRDFTFSGVPEHGELRLRWECRVETLTWLPGFASRRVDPRPEPWGEVDGEPSTAIPKGSKAGILQAVLFPER